MCAVPSQVPHPAPAQRIQRRARACDDVVPDGLAIGDVRHTDRVHPRDQTLERTDVLLEEFARCHFSVRVRRAIQHLAERCTHIANPYVERRSGLRFTPGELEAHDAATSARQKRRSGESRTSSPNVSASCAPSSKGAIRRLSTGVRGGSTPALALSTAFLAGRACPVQTARTLPAARLSGCALNTEGRPPSGGEPRGGPVLSVAR